MIYNLNTHTHTLKPNTYIYRYIDRNTQIQAHVHAYTHARMHSLISTGFQYLHTFKSKSETYTWEKVWLGG